jgi:hypothetical protein
MTYTNGPPDAWTTATQLSWGGLQIGAVTDPPGGAQSQKRWPTRPHAKRVRRAGTGTAGQHHCKPLQHRLQPSTASPVPEGQPVDLFSKRCLRAGAIAAEEAPDL